MAEPDAPQPTIRKLWRLAALVYILSGFAFPLRTEWLNVGRDATFEAPDAWMGGYDAARLQSALDALEPAGRRLYAWSEVTLDLLFPAAYGALLFGLLRRVAHRPARWAGVWHGWVPWLPGVAALADVIENVALFCAAYPLTSAEAAATWASLAGRVKWNLVWVSLGLLLLGLGLTGRLGRWTRLAWLGRVPLFGLAVLALLPGLASSAQASPTIPNLFSMHTWCALAAVSFAACYTAALAGFSLKLTWDLAPLRTGAELPPQPAWMAAHAPGSARVGRPFVLLALPLVFLACVRTALDYTRSSSPQGVAPLPALLATVAGIVVAVGLLPLVDWLTRRLSRRSAWLDAAAPRVERWLGPGYVRDGAFGPGHGLATAGLVLLLLAYALGGLLLAPDASAPRTADLPTLVYVLALAALVVSLLTGLTFHFDRWRVPLLALIVAFLATGERLCPDDHRFEARWTAEPLPRVSEALHRRLERAPSQVVVISASGGGIQAAAWTARVLAGLEQEFGPAFARSIAVISAVSGGSTGAYFWLSGFGPEGHLRAGADPAVFAAASASSLESAAWGLAYPDLQRSLAMPWGDARRDRGWAMEQSWITHRRAHGLGDGADEWLSDWAAGARDGRLPAVVLGAIRVDDGKPLHFASVRGAHEHGLRDDFRYAPVRAREGFLDLRTSTAARLSAAFPYATPFARPCAPDERGVCIGDLAGVRPWRAVDGGYLDNHGTLGALAWLTEVRETLDERALPVFWIHIDGLPEGDGRRLDTSPGWWMDLAGPVNGLLRVRTSGQALRSRVEVELLRERLGERLHTFTLQPDAGGSPRQAPLSWQLGWHDIERLERAWQRLRADDRGQLARLRQALAQVQPR